MGADMINDETTRQLMNVKAAASVKLHSTDYVVIKAQERSQILAPAWLAWREQLREVVRGNVDAIPSEPARYITPA